MTENNGTPRVGVSARTLGARPNIDITSDENGLVHPNTGGMSVSISPNDLPTHRKQQHMEEQVKTLYGQ